MVVFSITLSDSNQVLPLYDAEYLRNDTRYKYGYNGILTGTYIMPYIPK